MGDAVRLLLSVVSFAKRRITKMEELTINGIIYVRKDTLKNCKPLKVDGYEYKMVRTYSAGVFAGYLKSREGKEVVLLEARRIWSWAGASSLSQLAMSGTSQPDKCKFPEAVSEVILTEAIEILDISLKAKKTIDKVAIWKT